MVEDTYNIQNLLGYDQISEMQNNPAYRYDTIRQEFEKLTSKIIDNHITPMTTEIDVAYRFQFKVMDNMNIIGKMTSIPIMDIVLRPADIEPEPINQTRKYTIKERLKILFKGAL